VPKSWKRTSAGVYVVSHVDVELGGTTRLTALLIAILDTRFGALVQLYDKVDGDLGTVGPFERRRSHAVADHGALDDELLVAELVGERDGSHLAA